MQHTKYWSNSKFANWIRKIKKPEAATLEEWDQWEKTTKKSHPIRYWIAEEFLGSLQDLLSWPYDRLHAATYYFRNRFIDKSHYCKTGLKPGQWHETDTVIMHGMFTELERFVKDQKAWMAYISESKKYSDIPFWKTIWPFRHFTSFDNEELGLEYLRWEASLKRDDNWFGCGEWSTPEELAEARAKEDYGLPTYQAKAAMEVLDIYEWWTKIRPNRKDPYEASGWSEYCEAMKLKYGGGLSYMNKETPEEQEISRKRLEKLHEIEEQYDKEDTEYMIKLIKVRRSLWT